MKDNFRKHGSAPYDIVLVHGGPGAVGEMLPVAEELAPGRGVLEALQGGSQAGQPPTIAGLTAELRTTIADQADPPVTLIGYSWGAWLSFLLAARFPPLVKRLILISCGPLAEKYVPQTVETRLKRLTKEERDEVTRLFDSLTSLPQQERNAAFTRAGSLLAKADAYDLMDESPAEAALDVEMYLSIWPEAAEMRRSGVLLGQGGKIRCPVVAIHGDFDPHPAAGVLEPLTAVLADFQFILLEHCGHKPWIEAQAKAPFYKVLGDNL